ncbi:MAG: type VI secretion system baseplate subunit TssE [Thermoguttaceae bacterium]
MSSIRSDQPVIPSVLDRLLDEEPSNPREAPKSRTQVLRELKQSVRRDLENLLNTRWRCRSWPGHLKELDTSLVSYGIPDVTGADLSSAQRREEFRSQLERVIRHFEPRLKNVSVILLEQGEPWDRTLRFRIEGLLLVEPAPEPVAYDSAVEPATGTVEVRGTSL